MSLFSLYCRKKMILGRAAVLPSLFLTCKQDHLLLSGVTLGADFSVILYQEHRQLLESIVCALFSYREKDFVKSFTIAQIWFSSNSDLKMAAGTWLDVTGDV